MPESVLRYLGDLHDVLPYHWVGVISTLASVLCGSVIGIERERADKPAGMRTLILICLGSAIFTIMSRLMVEGTDGDRSRIAAQIVTGIGFLGAGAILRERGLVVGVTTGAGIWATAAVGMVLGGGYIAAGLFFTLLVVGTLSAAKLAETAARGSCRMVPLRVAFRGDATMALIRVQAVLDEYATGLQARIVERSDGRSVIAFDYCESHRDHRSFLRSLIDLPGLDEIRNHHSIVSSPAESDPQ